jgi:dTMP kinase
MFIAIEGPDGSGKTEVAKRLAAHYRNGGHKVVSTREPGGTIMAEEIRDVLLKPRNEPFSPLTELLLFNAARVQHNNMVLRPARSEGVIVICERYFVSTYVYQCLMGGIPTQLFYDINDACHHLLPDRLIYMDVTAEESVRRQKAVTLDRMDTMFQNREDLITNYATGVQDVTRRYSIPVTYIDTTFRSPAQVADMIITSLRLPFHE